MPRGKFRSRFRTGNPFGRILVNSEAAIVTAASPGGLLYVCQNEFAVDFASDEFDRVAFRHIVDYRLIGFKHHGHPRHV